MATKKSGTKSATQKSSGKNGKSAKPGKRKKNSQNEGDPPIVIGGGGSILIYSNMPLEIAEGAPPLEGYPNVYVYPDRTKSPKHFRNKRRRGGGQVWKRSFDPALDLLEVETD